MAAVLPFKGLLYNPEKIGRIEDVVSPPYDVIPPEKQMELHERHPNNVVRLILGRAAETDSASDNPHTRSAAYFRSWIKEGILVQESSPAFYLTSVSFTADGKTVTRYGLMAIVGLEPFKNGVILPHEQTFSKVKSERLELLKRCKANFSPIFTFYPDEEKRLIRIFEECAEQIAPLFDLEDDVRERHRLYRISDPDRVGRITGLMKNQRLFIADGHHRYETALNYREWLKETDPDFSENHPANFIMMYICSMEDTGLVIFPTHRMVTRVDGPISGRFLEKAAAYFDIRSIAFKEKGEAAAFEEMMAELKKRPDQTVFGVARREGAAFDLLYLKEGAAERVFGDTIPPLLAHLDVTILTHLIFSRLLDISQERLDDQGLIKYSSRADHAVSQVVSGQADMAFIMNPAKIKQVQEIAQEGLIMPRKTTYFYPKALTGLVMNDLSR